MNGMKDNIYYYPPEELRKLADQINRKRIVLNLDGSEVGKITAVYLDGTCDVQCVGIPRDSLPRIGRIRPIKDTGRVFRTYERVRIAADQTPADVGECDTVLEYEMAAFDDTVLE
jgi:hypothetical protein